MLKLIMENNVRVIRNGEGEYVAQFYTTVILGTDEEEAQKKANDIYSEYEELMGKLIEEHEHD